MIVPHRVCLCPLRLGGADLFLQVLAPGHVAEIGWVLRGRGVDLSGRTVVGGNGRAVIACVVPAEVDEVAMTVEGGGEEATFEAHRFGQPVSLRLPLQGQALVVAGHRIGEVHRSAWELPSQGFGWDFVPLSGKTLALLADPWDGGDLPAANFAAYGAPVLAPAEGKVVSVLDGEEDLETAGELPDPDAFRDDLTRAAGNHVVIDHGAGVWSLLAHLQQTSICVEQGAHVSAGQQLAALGNSGFSSGPHLHFHCMDGPRLTEASPLPVQLDVEAMQLDPQAGEIVSSD